MNWDANADTMSGAPNNADVAKIYRAGFMNPDGLGELEKIRFNQLVTQMVLNFKEYDKGLYDFPTYQAWQRNMCSHLKIPGGQLWWQDFELGFNNWRFCRFF